MYLRLMQVGKRYFNTSGPNIIAKHYTLMRSQLVSKGIDLVNDERYFTIWAPRQTGKSTYFQLLADQLKGLGYQVLLLSVESYKKVRESYLLRRIREELQAQTEWRINPEHIEELEGEFRAIKEGKLVMIVDEIEGLNPDLFYQIPLI